VQRFDSRRSGWSGVTRDPQLIHQPASSRAPVNSRTNRWMQNHGRTLSYAASKSSLAPCGDIETYLRNRAAFSYNSSLISGSGKYSSNNCAGVLGTSFSESSAIESYSLTIDSHPSIQVGARVPYVGAGLTGHSARPSPASLPTIY